MTALAAKALELARARIGVAEHPPGSNRGHEVDAWLRRMGLDPEKGAYPWCAAFLSCMIEDAAKALGVARQFHGSARVRSVLMLNGVLEIPAPESGCVFIHLGQDGKGHTGFVESIAADGTLHTIEGNSDAHGSRTGGSVVAGTRAPAYAQHYLVIA